MIDFFTDNDIINKGGSNTAKTPTNELSEPTPNNVEVQPLLDKIAELEQKLENLAINNTIDNNNNSEEKGTE